MQLKEIDKERYSKHFKQLFIGVVLLMLIVGVGSGQLLILLFTDGEGTHTLLNAIGVLTAALITGSLLRRYKEHPFMYELLYVWELKQQLNKIYRKQKAIKAAMEEGDRDAMVIMNFSYQGSKQLYHLDNNTLTMEELNRSIVELEKLLEQYQYQITLEEYRQELLERF